MAEARIRLSCELSAFTFAVVAVPVAVVHASVQIHPHSSAGVLVEAANRFMG